MKNLNREIDIERSTLINNEKLFLKSLTHIDDYLDTLVDLTEISSSRYGYADVMYKLAMNSEFSLIYTKLTGFRDLYSMKADLKLIEALNDTAVKRPLLDIEQTSLKKLTQNLIYWNILGNESEYLLKNHNIDLKTEVTEEIKEILNNESKFEIIENINKKLMKIHTNSSILAFFDGVLQTQVESGDMSSMLNSFKQINFTSITEANKSIIDTVERYNKKFDCEISITDDEILSSIYKSFELSLKDNYQRDFYEEVHREKINILGLSKLLLVYESSLLKENANNVIFPKIMKKIDMKIDSVENVRVKTNLDFLLQECQDLKIEFYTADEPDLVRLKSNIIKNLGEQVMKVANFIENEHLVKTQFQNKSKYIFRKLNVASKVSLDKMQKTVTTLINDNDALAYGLNRFFEGFSIEKPEADKQNKLNNS